MTELVSLTPPSFFFFFFLSFSSFLLLLFLLALLSHLVVARLSKKTRGARPPHQPHEKPHGFFHVALRSPATGIANNTQAHTERQQADGCCCCCYCCCGVAMQWRDDTGSVAGKAGGYCWDSSATAKAKGTLLLTPPPGKGAREQEPHPPTHHPPNQILECIAGYSPGRHTTYWFSPGTLADFRQRCPVSTTTWAETA